MNTRKAILKGESLTYVLVEEEKVIRDKWMHIAHAKGISLMTYPDPDWFLHDLRHDVFRGRERFYLDQDFGSVRGVGLQLSRLIKTKWPEAYTSLVTGYPGFMFRSELREGMVNDVFGKYPWPFDNAQVATIEERNEREVWAPIMSPFGGSNG